MSELTNPEQLRAAGKLRTAWALLPGNMTAEPLAAVALECCGIDTDAESDDMNELWDDVAQLIHDLGAEGVDDAEMVDQVVTLIFQARP